MILTEDPRSLRPNLTNDITNPCVMAASGSNDFYGKPNTQLQPKPARSLPYI